MDPRRWRGALRCSLVGVVRTLTRLRGRLPRSANRTLDRIRWRLPDRWVSAVTGRDAGRTADWDVPDAHVRPEVPDAPIRLLIGPANFGGQGYAWSRAVERSIPGTAAVCFALQIDGGFDFRDDYSVAPTVYRRSRRWQQEQFAYVSSSFTHVIIEAGRSLFADLFNLDPFKEAAALEKSGVRVAMMSHGTDSRLPRQHAQRHEWSPFRDRDWPELRRLRRRAEDFVKGLRRFSGPVFVSTPDLLDDLPFATWCPVVVDTDRWRSGSPVLARERPVVVHAPSNSRVKGTEYVDAAMVPLHERGVIEYRRIERVASAEMPDVYQEADIVLDQFRLGSYGVAACEAMAAGRVVVGNVTAEVRERVRATTGFDLPVVQAEPDAIGDVVERLLLDRDRGATAARDGVTFIEQVHAGQFSASVLSRFLSGTAGV